MRTFGSPSDRRWRAPWRSGRSARSRPPPPSRRENSAQGSPASVKSPLVNGFGRFIHGCGFRARRGSTRDGDRCAPRRIGSVGRRRSEALRRLAAAGGRRLRGLWRLQLSVPDGLPRAPDEPTRPRSRRRASPSPLSPELGEEDWRRAKAALAVALDPQGAGARVSWDNPDTDAEGRLHPGRPALREERRDLPRLPRRRSHGQGAAAALAGHRLPAIRRRMGDQGREAVPKGWPERAGRLEHDALAFAQSRRPAGPVARRQHLPIWPGAGSMIGRPMRNPYDILGVPRTAERGGDQEGVPQARQGPPSRPQPGRSEGEGQVRRGQHRLRDPRRRGQARPVRPRRDRCRGQAAIPGLQGLSGAGAAAAGGVREHFGFVGRPFAGRRGGAGAGRRRYLLADVRRGLPQRRGRGAAGAPRKRQGRGHRGDPRR